MRYDMPSSSLPDLSHARANDAASHGHEDVRRSFVLFVFLARSRPLCIRVAKKKGEAAHETLRSQREEGLARARPSQCKNRPQKKIGGWGDEDIRPTNVSV